MQNRGYSDQPFFFLIWILKHGNFGCSMSRGRRFVIVFVTSLEFNSCLNTAVRHPLQEFNAPWVMAAELRNMTHVAAASMSSASNGRYTTHVAAASMSSVSDGRYTAHVAAASMSSVSDGRYTTQVAAASMSSVSDVRNNCHLCDDSVIIIHLHKAIRCINI